MSEDHAFMRNMMPSLERMEKLEVELILAELQRRDLVNHASALTTDELRMRAMQWDRDPPCPNCGSGAHFEC